MNDDDFEALMRRERIIDVVLIVALIVALCWLA